MPAGGVNASLCPVQHSTVVSSPRYGPSSSFFPGNNEAMTPSFFFPGNNEAMSPLPGSGRRRI